MDASESGAALQTPANLGVVTLKRVALALVLALVCGPVVVGAKEPPAHEGDLEAIAGAVWRRPADKGPDWVRLASENPKKGEFLFQVWVYPDQHAKGKPLQGFGSGAL